MLILLPGRSHLCTALSCTIERSLGYYGGVVLQPASQKRPDSELRTANSVRALSCVKDLRSLVE